VWAISFQGRYTSLLVHEDRYLLALIRYIHRNPVRAGIVSRATDYLWSSDRFLRRGRGPAWLDVDGTLAALGPTRRSAVANYIELVDEPSGGTDDSDLPAIARAVEGDDAFALERFTAADQLEPPLPGLTEQRVLDAVAGDTGFSLVDLAGPRRGGQIAFARSLAAYLARRFGNISVRRMARLLRRDDSTFSRPLARLEARLPDDPALRLQVDRLLHRLKSPNQD
jgi:hypothetical protein